MSRDLLVIAGLAILYFVLKHETLGRRLVVAILGDRGLAAVGRASVASQPDHLTLRPATDAPVPKAKSLAEAIRVRGFTEGGRFTIAEMPGVRVRFLVREEDSIVAVVYEHEKVGVWCDMNTGYLDGTSYTLTNTTAGGGLNDRPGHPIVRVPGLTPAAQHMRIVKDRPAGAMISVSAEEAPDYFANAYAEGIAWRKNAGITVREVRGAAMDRLKAS